MRLLVTPQVGVWIEIMLVPVTVGVIEVTPQVGVRIEIDLLSGNL